MSNKLPVIAFTMGDPGGNGPELVLRTIDYYAINYPFIPIIFGSQSLLDHMFLSSFAKHRQIKPFDITVELQEKVIYFCNSYDTDQFEFNRPGECNGKASYQYICDAYSYIKAGVIDAMVTAPICKESFQMANIEYTGHTTLLKALANVNDVTMAFYTDSLKVVLATIHVALKDVPRLITAPLLEKKIKHAVDFLKQLGTPEFKIGVAGLNPHAGENGLFGVEEIETIAPLIQNGYFGDNVDVAGPFSADTLFYRAKQGDFDCVVAMYHDQGLIPIKTTHFHSAVNVTLGLPFVRTSPDHGTAFDRAYEQLSSIESMLAATQLACKLVKQHEKA